MRKIRRYYGYDCDSVNGFNSGYYLDDDFIETSDPFEACKDILIQKWTLDNDPNDLTELENGYEFITGYFDNEGNELTRDQFIERDSDSDTYSYVYVTFETKE